MELAQQHDLLLGEALERPPCLHFSVGEVLYVPPNILFCIEEPLDVPPLDELRSGEGLAYLHALLYSLYRFRGSSTKILKYIFYF